MGDSRRVWLIGTTLQRSAHACMQRTLTSHQVLHPPPQAVPLLPNGRRLRSCTKFLPFYIEETCTSYSLFHNHGQDCNKLLFLCILTVKRSCRILLRRVYALQPIFSSFKLRRVKDRNSIGCNVLSSSFFGKVVIYGGLFLMLTVGLQKLQPCHCSFCDTYSRRLLHRCVALMDVNLLHMSPYLLQLLHYMKEFTQQHRQNTVVICASTLARNTAFSQKLHKTTPISLKKEGFATFCQK